MIVDRFEHNGEQFVIDVYLRGYRNDDLVVVARYDDGLGGTFGGLVNGFEYLVHNVGGLTIEKACALQAVQRLAALAKKDILEDAWKSYQQELVSVGALPHVP
ncbi:hypothetical protein ACYPKM_01745 [Pseudomonas aeruginosa]